MKNTHRVILSGFIFLLFASCMISAAGRKETAVEGDILLAVRDNGDLRSSDSQLQLSGMNAATLYLPTRFTVTSDGAVSFSRESNLTGFEMTGGEGPMVGDVKIAQYSIEFTNALPRLKGRRLTITLPLSSLLLNPTETLIFQALRDSGQSSGIFALRSAGVSPQKKIGMAVVEVGR